MTEHTMTQSGIESIQAMFARARSEGRAAFLPYYPVGYPDYAASLDAVEAMAGVGVDGFEIGMPFSDPLADGPTIQAATQVALKNGITARRCLDAVRDLRARGVEQPMLLMGYLNPLLAYGLDAFARDAKTAGADGFIIPDLPPDEAAAFIEVCKREGLALPFFLAPTSRAERIALVGERASGFIYMVSLTGVTGARSALPADLAAFIERVRAQVDQPLVLGFGISAPDHVRAINRSVDGFIVGSALVRVGGTGVDAVKSLAASLRAAGDGDSP
jgi:tryptophan synthase alpha chain